MSVEEEAEIADIRCLGNRDWFEGDWRTECSLEGKSELHASLNTPKDASSRTSGKS